MKINVYRNFKGITELVGVINYEIDGPSYFAYEMDYITKARRNRELGISAQMPLNKNEYTEDEFRPFFQGLLPEGEQLATISRQLQVDRSDYLRLLSKLGCESIGALTFVSENENLEEFKPSYIKLGEELIDQFKAQPKTATEINAANIRLSLSGAQSKTAWYLPPGIDSKKAKLQDWLLPVNTAPSSHIIKVFNGENLEIALNELACSLIAKACGINTCEINIFNDIPGAIAIKRFDRYWENMDGEEKLVRLHQEDFCQALGFPGFAKYQNEYIEVDYLLKMFDMIEEVSSSFREDVNEIAKRTVFNYIIGNTDAHLKNFSLLYNKSWTARKLAPMYDITCIPLTGYLTEFAFAIGEHKLLDEIDKNDILSIALSLDINLNLFDKLIHEILNGLSNIRIENSNKKLNKMVDKILDNAKPRIKVVKDFING